MLFPSPGVATIENQVVSSFDLHSLNFWGYKSAFTKVFVKVLRKPSVLLAVLLTETCNALLIFLTYIVPYTEQMKILWN